MTNHLWASSLLFQYHRSRGTCFYDPSSQSGSCHISSLAFIQITDPNLIDWSILSSRSSEISPASNNFWTPSTSPFSKKHFRCAFHWAGSESHPAKKNNSSSVYIMAAFLVSKITGNEIHRFSPASFGFPNKELLQNLPSGHYLLSWMNLLLIDHIRGWEWAATSDYLLIKATENVSFPMFFCQRISHEAIFWRRIFVLAHRASQIHSVGTGGLTRSAISHCSGGKKRPVAIAPAVAPAVLNKNSSESHL